MKFRSYVVTSLIAMMVMVGPALAADQRPLELYGVTLKDASREQIRRALKQHEVPITREDNGYWVDLYDPKRVLEGTTQLLVGYVNATQKFAYAMYVYPSFMDDQLVGKVINMVSGKYGRPTSQTGRLDLGPVTAKWVMAQGMQIEVSRKWPDTTTYLNFEDVAANIQMNKEMDDAKKDEERQKNKAQGSAF